MAPTDSNLEKQTAIVTFGFALRSRAVGMTSTPM
jgi:hypothetical protein